MKKNSIMISIITILLVGVLLMINRTNAQTAQLSLSITAWTISDCTSATGINVGNSQAGPLSSTLSGNIWVGDNFGCTDLKGDTWRNYTISSSDFVGTPQWSIPADNISLLPSGLIMVTQWFCPSVSTGAWWILSTAKTLITKNDGYGQTCTFYLPSEQVKIIVEVPAWTPVGSYSSTFTIIYPS